MHADFCQVVPLDEKTVIMYLTVAGSQVVLFQAIFETYEGIGTVRTVDIRRSIVSVITTVDQVPECQKLLASMQQQFGLSCAAHRIKNDPITS